MRPAAAVVLATAVLGASPTAGEIPLADRKSGYEFMARETRAMQDDDTANPGMLWVLDGEALWKRKEGSAGKSCADCHGDARVSMKGVAARYPAFNAARGRPVDLEERINICRTQQQQSTPLPFESKELLALAAYVGQQSRGMPQAPLSRRATRPAIRSIASNGKRSDRCSGGCATACSECAPSPIPWARPNTSISNFI